MKFHIRVLLKILGGKNRIGDNIYRATYPASEGLHELSVDGADTSESKECSEQQRHLCLIDSLNVGRRQVGRDLTAQNNM